MHTAEAIMQSSGLPIPVWGYLLFSIIIAPIINILPTLGEELGWRGYLQFHIGEELGNVKAILLTGLIWGIWHAPMIAMGHNYGTGYKGYPVLGILMMILFCMVIAVIEGYVTLKSDSAVPAAVCHSAVNALAATGMMFCATTPNLLLGPTICGIITLIPACIFAGVLLMKMKKGNM